MGKIDSLTEVKISELQASIYTPGTWNTVTKIRTFEAISTISFFLQCMNLCMFSLIPATVQVDAGRSSQVNRQVNVGVKVTV